jgi:hypothetical protein
MFRVVLVAALVAASSSAASGAGFDSTAVLERPRRPAMVPT